MADKQDYYELLGVPKTASADEIKKAYRQMVKKYHPDLHPDDKEAEEKFKAVNEAYEVLSDPDKKQKYDRFGFAGVDPNYGAGQPGGGFGGGFGGGMDFDLGDIFSSFFGGGFSSRDANPNAPQRGSDIQSNIRISFQEAAKGCQKTLDIHRIEVCDRCSGTCAEPGTNVQTCPQCGGRGQVTSQRRMPFGTISSQTVCPRCQGRGNIVPTPCTKCKGNGRIRRPVKVDVSIPAGIDDRQSFSVRGQGNKGVNGGPAGDLRVNVNVNPDPFFKRDGFNVFCDVPISFAQAAMGVDLMVPTLDGKVKLTVPAGTQPMQEFRLRDRGITHVSGRGKGDQFVRIIVTVPKRLTNEQREMISQFSRDMHDGSPFAVNGGEDDDKKGIFSKKRK